MAVRVPLKFPAVRRPILLYAHDLTLLQQSYSTGYNAVIRELVHRHANTIRAKTARKAEGLPDAESSNT